MPGLVYAPNTPLTPQDDSWSCSCATTAWMLQSVGIDAPYPVVEAEMVAAGLVSPTWGLLDGSATALSAWITETYGIPTGHMQPVGWDTVYLHAGELPIGLGGMSWNHWSGCRATTSGMLSLANPAPNWMGINQTMTQADFARLGPFACWWIRV